MTIVAAIWWIRHGRTGSRPTSGLLGGGVATALALGYGSHLVVDLFTASGVPWLFPVSRVAYGVDAGIHSVEYSLVLWLLGSLGYLVQWRRTRSERTPSERTTQ